MINLKPLQVKLGHTFRDNALLMRALTHRSKQKLKNNERLEFLGDSILSLIISTEIFRRYPQFREGELSRLRAALVKGETIAKITVDLGINDCLQLGVGELKSGGYHRESILAGAFEAVIGAIYMDADFQTTQQCVLMWYGDLIEMIDTQTDVKDAKTTLQEWLQARQMTLPSYQFTVTGDAHEQTFSVVCRVEGLPYETEGVSTSRRKAEQIAAKSFLNKLIEK
ncbi:MAG: ribonuclease III [Gammaproteobacteria bacterium CG_4_10_14_0_8_um_filter_38_16]|nr:MAG: ribonuclease III [Gammaproteobacteria bacterium CG_4_10_14_0_8_um_filter_38_16]PJA03357.1 MAG: ribonuclease III [Gammaproteobacteria bacterium CG_4_10_14_0_2_um_filter_38_22]PJB10671.1 MAG: ribonuclease III [Gammaproteobacteria bacterium CG_4_9_14_3_um_filter_38_9]